MVVGLLFGAETDISTEISHQTEIANEYMYNIQKTDVYAPTIAPTYSMVHNPILQFNSPSGSIGGSPVSVAPQATGTQVIPQLIPSQGIAQGQESSSSGITGGGGIMDYIIVIAVIAVGALVVLPMIFKKKVKAKATTPTGIGGEIDT